MKNKVYQEAIDIHTTAAALDTTAENGSDDPGPDPTKPMTAGDLFKHSRGILDPHWAQSIIYEPRMGDTEFIKVSDVLEQHSTELQTKLEAGNIKAGSNVTVTADGNDVTISSDSNGPQNAKFVYCDGSDDHLKIQAAIDEVTDTSIPTVIYPVGECVLKVVARGVPEDVYQIINLITLGDNMTLDGKYCKIILDFTTPFTETDNEAFVTIFKVGDNGGIVNCRIYQQGEHVCYHRLVSCYSYALGPWAKEIQFVNNKLFNLRPRLETFNLSAYGYIFLNSGIMKDNQFKNIDSTDCEIFISANSTISHNIFENITCGGKLISLSGSRHFSKNCFTNITGPVFYESTFDNLIEIKSALCIISENCFNSINLYGGSVISLSGRQASVVNNTVSNFKLLEADTYEESFGIIGVEGMETVISGNKICFSTTLSQTHRKAPLTVSGNYCVVADNITNYTSIGEVTGTGSIQRDNIATGQITD